MNELLVGIVGVGNMGGAHAHCIARGDIKGMKLAALCDTDADKRELLKKEFPGIPVFRSHNELLKSGVCGAVIIATPHKFHPVVACDALNAGLHVLTEKPAAVKVSDVKRMTDAADKSGKVFAVMFNQRTNPVFKKAREIVKNGELGELKRFVWIITNWYRTQYYYNSGGWRATWSGEGGGVLLNQAPHNLDIWQWIFGMPKRVRAFCGVGKYHNIEVEDDATIYAEYENGAAATFITSTGECPGTNRLEISGDRGKLVIEDGRLKWWKLKEPERVFCFEKEESFYKPDTEFSEIVPNEPETAHRGVLQAFADAVLNGSELVADGREGINELTLSNASYLSSWTDRWVELPLDCDAFNKELDARIKASKLHGAKAENMSKDYNERWSVRW
ncbi:MAG: Gfo/Idh/MocA family oxidoreductase [Clostridia bacterium]|nr:Gfo/Idh/MocA family oxidoreductase [Clostridia bacterium]